MTKLLNDLARVMWRVNRIDCEEYALRYIQFFEDHADEIERNAMDALSHENERRDTLLMVMALIDSAGGRVEIGCSSILRANQLRLVRERNPETGTEIFRTVPNTDDAMRGGGE